MDNSKPFPIYQLMDAFEAFSNGEPDVKPQHRSLYYFLVGYARKRGNVPRFNMPYENGMHGSGIGSWATYDAALKAIAGWGFIVYTPGANRYKVPVIELTFRNPSDDQLLTYWQSYCIATSVELQNQRPTSNPTSNSTANPTDDVLLTQLATYKDLLEEERKRVEEVERLRDQDKHEQAKDEASLRAAIVSAEKKIASRDLRIAELKELLAGEGETINRLTNEISTLKANAQASHTQGAQPFRAYDASDYSPALKLPFETDEFRGAWTKWRLYHANELKKPLGGGMREQEALRKIATLSDKTEAVALAIIDQAISKGWKDVFPLDSSSPAHSSNTNPQAHAVTGSPIRTQPGQKPGGNAGQLARALAERRAG